MTDILKSFSALQCELDVAKTTLKGVDENIKRLIGRDPSELPTRPPIKRNNVTQIEDRDRGRPRGLGNQTEERKFRNPRLRMFVQENEEPPIKKRTAGISVFKRLSDRPIHDDSQAKPHKGMISKVIVTPKEVPSRQERMDAQSKDATSNARNKRMFGALLGTLQKFQQEESKLKNKEDKRAQLEKKIEEHEIKEKEEIKKERQELFFNRKKKQAEIKMIELKMIRMKEHTAWEDSLKHRMNFIYTKAKPQIHFLPRKLNNAHKTLLESSRADIQSIIDKKRERVQEELMHIEARGKRIFEPRKFQQSGKEKENDENDNENSMDEEDVTMEDLSQQNKDEEKKLLISENTEDMKVNVEGEIHGDTGEQEVQGEENMWNTDNSQVENNSHEPEVPVLNDTPSDINMEFPVEVEVASFEEIQVQNDFGYANNVTSSSTEFIEEDQANSGLNIDDSLVVPDALPAV